jgi:hypothetical protein
VGVCSAVAEGMHQLGAAHPHAQRPGRHVPVGRGRLPAGD